MDDMTTDILLRSALMVALLSGCSSGYEVSLVVTDVVNSSCNTSCVGSVSIEAYGDGNNDFEATCLQDVTMASLRDHGLRGAIDIPAPDSLRGVSLVGWRGKACDDLIVFAGVKRVDGSTIGIPVECNASCASTATMSIQTTSLLAAMQGRCEISIATSASAGTLRATHFERIFPGANETVFSGGPLATVAAGAASIPGSVIASGSSQSCAAVMLFKDGGPSSAACVRFGRPGLCAAGTTTEVPGFPAPAMLTPDGFRTVAIFAERDLATGLPKPIVGAVAAVDADQAPARIEYLDLGVEAGAPVLVPRATLSTGPSGAFAVYSKEPVRVTVTKDALRSQRLVSGGTWFGVNIVEVGGAQIFTPD
jgi:hypothetical protein